jgi:DNA-binding transcriptional ArsR family regulator
MNAVNNYTLILNGDATSALPVKLDLMNLKKAAVILRAINHKLRQQMLRLLDEHKRLTVTELYIHLRLEQSVASQHLAILRRAGFVKTQRDGKFIYYTVNTDRLSDVNKLIADLLE